MSESVVANPFGEDPSSDSRTSVGRVEEQRAVAEVQAAMVIARSNPRNQRQAMSRVLDACTRPRLAEKAEYAYSRGGTDISGPSVHLARAVAQGWGNIQYGIRELEQRDGMSVVQTYCWDLETGARSERTFVAQHQRSKRSGTERVSDPRDVYELVANAAGRRVRACILDIIPGDVIEAAQEQCALTLKASSDVTEEGVAALVEAFEPLGVSREMIELRIQRHIKAIKPAQVMMLKRIWMSLRDGMSVVADWFEKPATGDGPRGVAAVEALVAPKARPTEDTGLTAGEAGQDASLGDADFDDLPGDTPDPSADCLTQGCRQAALTDSAHCQEHQDAIEQRQRDLASPGKNRYAEAVWVWDLPKAWMGRTLGDIGKTVGATKFMSDWIDDPSNADKDPLFTNNVRKFLNEEAST